jgi:pSer/pThr/pTyr-binding forkhead associated (FHA) protein
MPILRVLLPNIPPVVHVLTSGRVTVGRRPDNTIQILDPSISAHHAEFLLVDDHYRIHDLGSTNLTLVQDTPVTDFHLHHACKINFGTVACEYEATPLPVGESGLTPVEMEKDVSFLRTENLDLRSKLIALQRQIDILSTARLITGKSEGSNGNDPDLVKRLMIERDEARYQNSGLKLEVETLRTELEAAVRERDLARRAHELLQGERIAAPEAARIENKGATQRIVFPMQAGSRE